MREQLPLQPLPPKRHEMAIDVRMTRTTQARYDRLALVYDAMEAFIERFRFSGWRQQLWSQARGDGLRILEVGVGTGKNMPYYPPGAVVTGIDLSPGMMDRARRRAGRMGIEADLQSMDVQQLNFPDDSFDAAVASFVFCSVPDPVLRLRELARVVKPGGQIVLLEHMRARNPVLGKLMDWLNPLVVRIMGANISRRTVENVQRAGLPLRQAEDLASDGIVRLIVSDVQ